LGSYCSTLCVSSTFDTPQILEHWQLLLYSFLYLLTHFILLRTENTGKMHNISINLFLVSVI
jgi:hypothetical protein